MGDEEQKIELQDGDSEFEDSESESDDLWRLGFVQEPEVPEALQPMYFPSKVGGRPSWLDPCRLPTNEQLQCKASVYGDVCGKPLCFLMQIYAPVSDSEEAFHRSLFVFSCRDGNCAGKDGSVRVLRCQLPRKNAHYAFEPPDYPKAGAKVVEISDQPECSNETKEAPSPAEAAETSTRLEEAIKIKQVGNDSFTRGNLDEALEKYASALAILGEGLRRSGAQAARQEYAKLRSNRAECLLQQRKFIEAVGECTAALEADSECGKAWFRRAKARLELSQRAGAHSIGAAQDARADAVRLLELDPDSEAGRRLVREAKAECGRAYLLEEQELQVEEEGSDLDDDTDDEQLAAHVKKLMDEYEKGRAEGAASKDDAEDEEQQLGQVGKEGSGKVDPELLRFKQRTQRDKEQCLRYCFSPTARPLLLHSSFTPPNPPAACPLCGAPRHFEFQVMPQLLFFLKAEEEGRGGVKELEMEWGTVLVYSCSATCTPPHGLASAYAEEFVAIQGQPT